MAERTESDPLYLAIAHPVRRAVLDALADEGELAPAALLARFELSFPALSQHLRVLRDADLVATRREGRRVLYRVTPAPLLELVAWMLRFETAWQGRLDRLGAALDAGAGDPGRTPATAKRTTRSRAGRTAGRRTAR